MAVKNAAGEGTVHAGVGAVGVHKLLVGTGFEDFAFADDEDFGGAGGGGEAVGDEKGGALLHDLLDGLCDNFFAHWVEVGSGFIEDEHLRVFDEGAGDGEALEFAAAEPDTTFAEHGFHSVWGAFYKRDSVGHFSGSKDFLFGGFGATEFEVVADGSGEEKSLLRDNAELGTEPVDFEFFVGDAVEGDFAGSGFVKAEDEVGDCGFSGTGGSDESEGFAGFEGETHIL